MDIFLMDIFFRTVKFAWLDKNVFYDQVFF